MRNLGILAGLFLLIFTSTGNASSKSNSGGDPNKRCKCKNSESSNYYQNFGYPGYYPPDGNYDFEYYSRLYYGQNTGEIKDTTITVRR